ncbi:ion transporter [Halostella sp. JP-L12]|uniref:pentapeptide repeat-containing protein n=1 Tax=Halostella TaxID=1843185 RepID=UPI000EF7D601|nr:MULTISPECIES: pentapeptide repeat-containing protein [Halostella]NHN47732.1 ion transporter [Halostella sp. JP-L12]
MPEDRCGYTHDVTAIRGAGEATCWRPVWGDRDRCVWHADERGKTENDLAELAPEDGERIDGAVITTTALNETDLFADATFFEAKFDNVRLRYADFSDANLQRSTFDGVDAYGATFRGADMEDSQIKNSDLRSATLIRTRLYQVAFSDTRVDRQTEFGPKVVYEEHLEESDDETTVATCHEAATWTYRQLESLFTQNADPVPTTKYFVREKDTRRKAAWKLGNYLRAVKMEASRWVMLYGTSPWRVLGSSAVVILLCAILFPITGGIQESGAEYAITYTLEQPEDTAVPVIVTVLFKSLYFSVVTFATLGFGDISPVGNFARMLAGIESLLGSLLLALLVYVLTMTPR